MFTPFSLQTTFFQRFAGIIWKKTHEITVNASSLFYMLGLHPQKIYTYFGFWKMFISFYLFHFGLDLDFYNVLCVLILKLLVIGYYLKMLWFILYIFFPAGGPGWFWWNYASITIIVLTTEVAFEWCWILHDVKCNTVVKVGCFTYPLCSASAIIYTSEIELWYIFKD